MCQGNANGDVPGYRPQGSLDRPGYRPPNQDMQGYRPQGNPLQRPYGNPGAGSWNQAYGGGGAGQTAPDDPYAAQGSMSGDMQPWQGRFDPSAPRGGGAEMQPAQNLWKPQGIDMRKPMQTNGTMPWRPPSGPMPQGAQIGGMGPDVTGVGGRAFNPGFMPQPFPENSPMIGPDGRPITSSSGYQPRTKPWQVR